MSDRFSVVIPGVPPSVNRLTVGRGKLRVGKGKVYRSPEWDAWKSDAVKLMQEAIRRDGYVAPGKKLRCRLVLVWFRPDARRRDSDNVLKAVGDALAIALDIDDAGFEYATYRALDRNNPRLFLRVEPDGGYFE